MSLEASIYLHATFGKKIQMKFIFIYTQMF